jgi:ATP-binding cassette subfamily C (CFTR/MRP) protein 1
VVAIVGRTGSGKSSLVSALLRLYPLSGGAVLVGGMDVSAYSAASVRASIAAVPQAPLLLRATVRDNLDPGGGRTDAEVWEAIQLAGLGRAVAALGPGGLRNLIQGPNALSAGEAQLLGLARAHLKQRKVCPPAPMPCGSAEGAPARRTT